MKGSEEVEMAPSPCTIGKTSKIKKYFGLLGGILFFLLIVAIIGKETRDYIDETIKEMTDSRIIVPKSPHITDKPVICVAGIRLPPFPDTMFPDFDNDTTNSAYIRVLQAVGSYPILLPSTDPLDMNLIASEMLMCDGLLLQGGQDLGPEFYDEEKSELCGETDRLMDMNHIEMYKTALKLNIPVLGICRGFQTMNVVSGGTLYQDLSERQLPPGVASDNHRELGTYREPKAHKIIIDKDSELYDILLHKEMMVNSLHHQGVKDVAPSFKVTARSPDGLVEAIENTDGRWVLGVQFHPELLTLHGGTLLPLIKRFVKEADKYRLQRFD